MKNLLLTVIAISLFMISCNKEKPILDVKESIKNTQSSSRADAIFGILKFQSIDELQVQIENLKSMPLDEFENFNAPNPNFTSLYAEYKIMDENADADISESASSAQERGKIANIQDDYFASVVNKDGLLIVEDKIYHYINNETFEVTELDNMDDTGNIDFSKAQRFSIGKSNWGNKQYASFPPTSHIFEQSSNGNNWPKKNNRPVRMVHTKWCSWYGAYVSIGSKVKMEKKSTLLGWININHDMASLQPLESNYRLWTIATGGWSYWSKSINSVTFGQNVNQWVLDYYVGLFPPVTGPIQYEVGTFRSNATGQLSGASLTDNWIH